MGMSESQSQAARNVLFDTNMLAPENVTTLARLASAPGVQVWFSAINAYEVGTAASKTDGGYEWRKNGVAFVLSRTRMLPFPEETIREAAGGAPDTEVAGRMQWLMEWLCKSTSRDEFIRGPQCPQLGYGRHSGVADLRDWRNCHEQAFADACRRMMAAIYDKLKLKADLTDKGWSLPCVRGKPLADLREFALSDEVRTPFLQAVLGRAGLEGTTEEVTHVAGPLDAYFRTWIGYVLRLIEKQLKPQPHDCNDVHLAVPMADASWLLVSQEGSGAKSKGLRDWMQNGGLPVGTGGVYLSRCEAERWLAALGPRGAE